MLKEKLFQSLAELETQMKDIQSATEKVNSVVSADRELVAKINEYAHTVNQQVQLLKQIFEGGVLEIAQHSKETLNQVQADFNAKVDDHINVVKGVGEDVICRIREVAKYESEQVVESLSGKLESTVGDLKSLGDAMVDLRHAIQQDIDVSQKAAEDTVQAVYKLDGLPDYIMQAVTQTRRTVESKEEERIRFMEDLSANIKEIQQHLKYQDAKLDELMKNQEEKFDGSKVLRYFLIGVLIVLCLIFFGA